MKSSNNISKKFIGGLFAALLGLAFTFTTAHAQVLYNNGTASSSSPNAELADTGSSYYPDGNIFYNGNPSGTANTIDFYGIYVLNNLPTDNFTITFDTASGGTILGPVSTSSLSNESRTAVGLQDGYYTLYHYVATLNTPISLDHGSSYYLGFTDATSPYGGFALAQTTTPGPATIQAYYANNTGPYYVSGRSFAWELSNVQAAPEPSTWALLLGGLGLLAFWRTRTRRALL
jgi:MYXO-CTERM domain-containing protein